MLNRDQMRKLLARGHKALHTTNQVSFDHFGHSYEIKDEVTFRQIDIGDLRLVNQNMRKASPNTAKVRKARKNGDDTAGITWLITKGGKWLGKTETFGGKTKTSLFLKERNSEDI